MVKVVLDIAPFFVVVNDEIVFNKLWEVIIPMEPTIIDIVADETGSSGYTLSSITYHAPRQ